MPDSRSPDSRRRGSREALCLLASLVGCATPPPPPTNPIHVAAVAQADDRKTCFETTKSYGLSATVRGDILRQAALSAANDAWTNSPAAKPKGIEPLDPQRCVGNNPAIPAGPPTAANYYGNVASKAGFLRLVRLGCAAELPQYFSMNDAIYYRNCAPGAGTGYIYFWGRPDGNTSQCFNGDYPTMFAKANGNKQDPDPVTVAKMSETYDGTGLRGSTQQAFALGNIMAAIQIAEAARDYFVMPANYMLIQLAIKKVITPTQIAAGHCPAHASGCGSPATQDGWHPLAWGGAQANMMTGGWGTNNGATSEYGQAFEAGLAISWLSSSGYIKKSSSQCNQQVPFTSLSVAQQDALRRPFDDLMKD